MAYGLVRINSVTGTKEWFAGDRPWGGMQALYWTMDVREAKDYGGRKDAQLVAREGFPSPHPTVERIIPE